MATTKIGVCAESFGLQELLVVVLFDDCDVLSSPSTTLTLCGEVGRMRFRVQCGGVHTCRDVFILARAV